ncbi:MAG: hypothetical protein U9R42_00190 [Bacteroidota bacterium]|nr:hypothetical protein [Bacteroidota bacterium]
MQKYINQLIEDLKEAEANPVQEIEFSEDYDEFVKQMKLIEEATHEPAENVLGIGYIELPPVERLSKAQIQQLMIAILNALSAKGTEITFPGNNIPVELAYSQLREKFKEGFYSMPGWIIDFCSGYCPDCAFKDYCDNYNKEEWDKL